MNYDDYGNGRPREIGEPGGVLDTFMNGNGRVTSFHLILAFIPIAFFASAFDILSGDTIELIFKILIGYWFFRIALALLLFLGGMGYAMFTSVKNGINFIRDIFRGRS